MLRAVIQHLNPKILRSPKACTYNGDKAGQTLHAEFSAFLPKLDNNSRRYTIETSEERF
jgi:hypothetical protein